MFKEIKAVLYGTSRRTNPVATTTGTMAPAVFDDVGRIVNYPYQVRDMIATAYVALANGTVTSLRAGTTGEFADLSFISLGNASSAAVTITLLDDSTTASAYEVPASGTVVVHYPTPLPQGATGSAWQVDMADITGTTVRITALFVRNV